jgi:hypothetical protein
MQRQKTPSPSRGEEKLGGFHLFLGGTRDKTRRRRKSHKSGGLFEKVFVEFKP